jgi:phosphoribosylformylglycinamidine cyclo-ligase
MTLKNNRGLTYADAGVDIDAGNSLIEAIKPAVQRAMRPEVLGGLGGFGGLFDIAKSGYTDPILVSGTDGVGTKLKIAQAMNIHDTIGIDLVAMCVNDLVVQGAEPLFFLDYFACGKLNTSVASDVITGIAEGCRQAGAALIGGETAEMPGMYAENDYDLAGFAVGAVERTQLMPYQDQLQRGDLLIGLPSSGVHSNGFSLVRKILEHSKTSLEHDVSGYIGNNCPSLSHWLLSPTRIYISQCLNIINECNVSPEDIAVKALIHITGGGFTENIPRVLPESLSAHIDLTGYTLPGGFRWLMEQGAVSQEEMLRTFNCGIGMIVIVKQSSAEDVLRNLRAQNEEPVILGSLIEHSESRVEYNGSLK